MSCRNYDPCLDGKLNQIGSYASVARQSAQASQASADQSQASASEANNYLTQVTNIFNDFDERYLGAKSVAPTLDNQGNPLQVGALYWNSSSNTMFVWDGAIWVAADFNEFTPFLATGTTTARNLVTRMADVVNVLDYGAFNNDSNPTQTTIAIQAAIDANPGKAIYFPSGTYAINDVLKIATTYTSLIGDAVGATFISMKDTTKPSAIEIKSNTIGGNVFGNVIRDLRLQSVASSNYQIGIIAEKCDQMNIMDCTIGGFSTSIDFRGCKVINCVGSKFNSFNTTGYLAGTATIQIRGSSYGSNVSGDTMMFTNCLFGTGTNDYTISIQSSDYNTFSNCYINRGNIAGVIIESSGTPFVAGNFNNNFDNCYFDRGTEDAGNPDVAGLLLSDAGGGVSQFTKVSDCIFTWWDFGVKLIKPSTLFDTATQIVNCRFIRCKKTAIYAESAAADANLLNVIIEGNILQNTGYAYSGSAAIDIKNIRQVTISGNAIGYDAVDTYIGSRSSIRLDGTITVASITGNTIASFIGAGVTDFTNTATVGQLAIHGNASNNPTNTIVGSIIGNKANTNPLSLNWYQEGVFTPELTFGGGNTGITYSDIQGNYTRIGNRMIFDIYIILSSKGTSTGNVSITGFPFTLSPTSVSRSTNTVAMERFDGIGDANIDAVWTAPTGLAIYYLNSSGDKVRLTDSNFRNNTGLWISGSAQVE